MRVEIWSDVVCPWCYIGKRRFEAALEQFAHRDEVEVVWRSFELNPGAPREARGNVTEQLANKYGMTPQQATEAHARMTALAAEEGLDFRLDRAQRANTFDAHRLIHLAAAHSRQGAMKERLLRAYFTEGLSVGDLETLVRLAGEVGLDPEEARAALAGDDYGAEVRADEARARAYGISGVPFFVLDETYGISGAQPTATVRQVLDQVWAETHPLVMAGAGEACGPDGCPLPEHDHNP